MLKRTLWHDVLPRLIVQECLEGCIFQFGPNIQWTKVVGTLARIFQNSNDLNTKRMIAEWGNFLTHFMRFSRRNADWHLYEWSIRWWPPALFSRLINTCTPCGSPMRPWWTSRSSSGGKWWKDWAGTQTPRLPWRCCRPLCVRSLTAQVGASLFPWLHVLSDDKVGEKQKVLHGWMPPHFWHTLDLDPGPNLGTKVHFPGLCTLAL